MDLGYIMGEGWVYCEGRVAGEQERGVRVCVCAGQGE